jgi:hypothetical protein
MDDDDIDPPELVIQFVDGLSPQARQTLCQLLAFYVSFIPRQDEDADDYSMPTPEMGEETLRRLLSTKDRFALLGGLISLVGLIDFAFAKIANVDPVPDLDEALEAKHGDMSIARRFISEGDKKWTELRRGQLSIEAIEEFSQRLMVVREPEPVQRTAVSMSAYPRLVELPVPQELVDELAEDFRQGPIVDDQGRRFLIEEQVDRLNNMVIVIQALEHPPPHFHVRHQGENASFAITDGSRLPGVKGLEKFDRNIKKWWTKNLCVLVEVWNRSRPSDCVVGPMEVPEECKEKSLTSLLVLDQGQRLEQTRKPHT